MTLDSRAQRMMYLIVIGTLTLSVLVFLFLLPKAHIIVTPYYKVFKKTYPVTLDPSLNIVLIPLNRIPVEKTVLDLDNPTETMIIAHEDILEFVMGKMESKKGENETIEKDTIQYNITYGEAQQKADIYVEAIISQKINNSALVRKIRGKLKSDAQTILSKHSAIKEITIETYPHWLFYIPIIESRVKIEKKLDL